MDDFDVENELFDNPELTHDLPNVNENGGETPTVETDGTTGSNNPRAVKKVVQKPRLKLDADRLCGERGLPAVNKMFENVDFKSKGYEKENLNKLMQILEHWAFRLFPKLPFEEIIDKVEKLGSKKPVQTCIKRIRLDMDAVVTDLVEEEPQRQAVSDNEEEFVDPFDELVAEHHFPDEVQRPPSPIIQTTSQTNGLSDEQVSRMEKNRLLAQERRKSRNLLVVNNGASTSSATIILD